jgi:RimJ/RimL family protein N-acetyltransferase
MENKIITTAITKTGKIVTFRYPTIDDTEILKNYINKISAEKSFILLQGIQKTLEEERKWLEEKLEMVNKKECVYILAFIKNDLIACSEITLEPLIKNHIGDFGITVAKKFRGEGIGKILMDLVIKESIKNIKNLKIITLECFGINIIGLNLYKKLGFKEYGILPGGLKRRGKYEDAILMYKKIK